MTALRPGRPRREAMPLSLRIPALPGTLSHETVILRRDNASRGTSCGEPKSAQISPGSRDTLRMRSYDAEDVPLE